MSKKKEVNSLPFVLPLDFYIKANELQEFKESFYTCFLEMEDYLNITILDSFLEMFLEEEKSKRQYSKFIADEELYFPKR